MFPEFPDKYEGADKPDEILAIADELEQSKNPSMCAIQHSTLFLVKCD
jgi:hypothetical protein